MVVGRVGRPNGIRGGVFVLPLTDSPEQRFAVGQQVLAGPPADRALVVSDLRFHNGKMIVTFEGQQTREDAEALRHCVLETEVSSSETPEDPDEYYDRQLHGLDVADPNGHVLGKVLTVLHLPAQDVLEIKLNDGPIRLVPFVKEIVTAVDISEGLVTISPPEGLLDGEDFGDTSPADGSPDAS